MNNSSIVSFSSKLLALGSSSLMRIILLLCCFCSLVIAENANFKATLDSWVVPGDVRFSNRLVVTVVDADTKQPITKLKIGATVQKEGSTLSPSLSEPGTRESYVYTNEKGEAVFFYRFDKSLSSETLRLPCQERISVFCKEFSYDKIIFLSIGTDMTFGNGAARIPPRWYPFEKVPLQLSLTDVSHPNFDLRTFKNMLEDASLELSLDGYDGSVASVDLSAYRFVFGGLGNDLTSNKDENRPPVLLNASSLRLDPTGTADYLLSSSDGIPSLVFKRPGTFSIKLLLKDLKGDSDEGNNFVSMVVPLPAMVPTPFDKVIETFTQVMPQTMAGKNYGFFHPLSEGDLIGFGVQFANFISDLAKYLHNEFSEKIVDELTLREMLLSFLLTDVLDNFEGLSGSDKKLFFRHISFSSPVTNQGLPVNDWIDSVVYGFLKNNTSDSVVFFECSDSLNTGMLKVVAGGKTFYPVKGNSIPSMEAATIVSTGGKYGALTYKRAKGVDSVTAFVPKGVKGIVHYSLDKDVLMILRAPLSLTEDSKITFIAGVGGKGLVSVTGINGGTQKEVVGLVAASALVVPEIDNSSSVEGKLFETIPSTIRFKVNYPGTLKKKDFSVTLDETILTDITLLKDNVIEATVSSTFQPGVHVVSLNYKDFSGITGHYKAAFMNCINLPIVKDQATWVLCGRTGKPESVPRDLPVKNNIVTTSKTPGKAETYVSVVPTKRTETVNTAKIADLPSSREPDVVSGLASVSPGLKEDGESGGGDVDSSEVSDAELYGGSTGTETDPGVASVNDMTPVPLIATEVAIAANPGMIVSQVIVCTTIEGKVGLGRGTRFVSGIPTLYLWYRFENNSQQNVEISTEWYYFSRTKGRYLLSLRDSKLLPPGSGSAFSPISRGEGKALPDGSYRVEVKSNGNVIEMIPFSIGSSN